MPLLAAKNSDPANFQSGSCESKTTFAAFNADLQLMWQNVDSSNVLVRIALPIVGGATFPQILLGLTNGSSGSIVARVPAKISKTHDAAAVIGVAEVMFVASVQPGTYYEWWVGRQVVEPVTGAYIKWGGQNSATSPATGAAIMEVWSA